MDVFAPEVSDPVNKVEMSAATIAALRMMMREEFTNGMKSSQVSPNARKRAQCNGEGGKEKNIQHKKWQILYNLQASLTERRRNNYMEQKSRKHGKRESHRAAFLATISQLPKALYLQNISNFVSQVCCGRPRGGYVGRGCHASVLLTQRSAGKFAM